MRIGVFDSGVGGLSVLNSIQSAVSRSPYKVSYAYCCDNKNFPYGIKTEEDVLQCVLEVCSRFTAQISLDVLVIACNTASTLALPALRAKLPMPIVGVVPAIKPAASASASKTIGVLATPAAIKGAYLDALIKEHGQGCKIVKCGSSVLVQMAEDKLRGKPVDQDALRHELTVFLDALPLGLDQLVLGCTHFPLLASEISQLLSSVHLVDSGDAVAARVIYLLNDLQKSTSAKMDTKSLDTDSQDGQVLGFCSGNGFHLDLAEPLFYRPARLVLQSLQ